ncbi:MAG: hypothetical protein Q8908_00855, partial [Bacteroidota bacterium]|nr:hypothetical protein [Bacteroidota bacterium]
MTDIYFPSIKHRLLKFIILFVLSIGFQIKDIAQTTNDETPLIGAEVFIEPGQTPQEIDTWFKRLKESHMTVTRIRMFENYMHKADGSWDF